MTSAQSWLDAAAFHWQDKRRIAREVASAPEMPPEAKECAKNLVLLCEILLLKAVEKYLKTL